MGLKSDLEEEVAAVFKAAWTERDGTVVPDEDSLKLGNDAIRLKATVLYADLADSTKLVDRYKPAFAAEIYKTFLHCAAKIIRTESGVITAYDGDRVMAVYIGDQKNTSAVRSALKIHYAARHIIGPAQSAQYGSTDYELKHVVGVDTSDLFVARTGVRGANDLVWVGRAANYAAKLAALPETYRTYITKQVYDLMNKEVKVASDGREIWQPLLWTEFDSRTIYGSTFWWTLS
jgi:class 3 adenylate cyclase